ncbi:RNA pyrophosphohydrolase [Alteriqipengyuania sp. WL0013]|uniref:RNA pyrophosphohydrolase n=1 Tax=Alteriqipengyuania sp. WL0013 TaxID=3110773 RepID=UPI002CC99E20|nr:RNA pyrophosphohydrolase [Alteriqipengyuania sp. WL0013]MEB3414788.1 RNA pyrophosphohydrolase [Alteriqipengyuania sp. WL0013]
MSDADLGRDRALYRPCVGVMLVNAHGKAFVGQRIDNREGDRWQMPQGGVDDGEDLEAAMLRELGEETGLTADKVEIVGRLPGELFYDLPDELKGKLWKGQFIGQRQVWYLARFTGEDADIDLEAHEHPEFCEWKWVDPDDLPKLIVPFKEEIYRAVVAEFRDRI